MSDYKKIIQIYNDDDAVKEVDNHYGAGTFEHLMDEIFSIHNKIKHQYRFLEQYSLQLDVSQLKSSNDIVIESYGSFHPNGDWAGTPSDWLHSPSDTLDDLPDVYKNSPNETEEVLGLKRELSIAKNVCDLLIEDVNELCSKYMRDINDNFDFDDEGKLETKRLNCLLFRNN